MQTVASASFGNAPGSAPLPVYPQPKKSGCGCCGCLTGCLLFLLLAFGGLAGSLFFLDLGKWADQSVYYGYRNVARPLIVESFSQKMNEAEKKQSLYVFDSYVEAYMKLPDAEKKPIRQEALIYLYYGSRGKTPPPEKITHLNAFIEKVVQELLRQYPDWGDAAPPAYQPPAPKDPEPYEPPRAEPPPPYQPPAPNIPEPYSPPPIEPPPPPVPTQPPPRLKF